jgi:3-isopropylmalate/(R)-2-methylmalate dehydratase small subunit
MEPIKAFTSSIVALPMENIDTDQIIPARYLKTTNKAGLGDGLFSDWRYNADGSPKPDFVLNRPDVRGAEILIAGHNFGCGSSREHAAWALEDRGFRVVIAPSFGDIFRTNSIKTGLAPISIEPEALARIRDAVAARNELTVDLEALVVTHPDGLRVDFAFDAHDRHTLINGLDDIARTLQQEAEITAYEGRVPPRFDARVIQG